MKYFFKNITHIIIHSARKMEISFLEIKDQEIKQRIYQQAILEMASNGRNKFCFNGALFTPFKNLDRDCFGSIFLNVNLKLWLRCKNIFVVFQLSNNYGQALPHGQSVSIDIKGERYTPFNNLGGFTLSNNLITHKMK